MTRKIDKEAIDTLIEDIKDAKIALEKAEIDQERGAKWIDTIKAQIEKDEHALEVALVREMKEGNFTKGDDRDAYDEQVKFC